MFAMDGELLNALPWARDAWAEPYNGWRADRTKTTRFCPRSRYARTRNAKGHECPFTVLACECHALASCALAREGRLPVRALPTPARALCLLVLAVHVLLPYSWLRSSVTDGGRVQGSACTLTGTPSSVVSNGGVILWVSTGSSDNISKAIASTHIHNKWLLHPQQNAFASTPNGICQHKERHLLAQSKAFAPTTKLASLQESLTSSAAKSQKKKVRLNPPVSMLLP